MLITPVLGTWDDVEAAGVDMIEYSVIRVISGTGAKRHIVTDALTATCCADRVPRPTTTPPLVSRSGVTLFLLLPHPHPYPHL